MDGTWSTPSDLESASPGEPALPPLLAPTLARPILPGASDAIGRRLGRRWQGARAAADEDGRQRRSHKQWKEKTDDVSRTIRFLKPCLLLGVFRMLMEINPRALIVLLILVVYGVFYLGACTSPIIVFVFCICTLSLFFSLYLTKWVLAKYEGPPKMTKEPS